MPTPRKPRRSCRCCGESVPHIANLYCDQKCQIEYERKTKDAAVYLTGSVTPHYKSSRTIKDFILRDRGCRCEICGGNCWQGQPIPLVLDHINGDSDDNRVLNLRLVCGNCDMQLPTYKSKNKGNGRHSRRQRYAEGKSF